jgi:hypothetical protein
MIRTPRWISATEFENFISEDKFCDWITSPIRPIEHPLSFLFQKGCEYEEKVINILRSKTHLPLEKQSTLKTSRDYTDVSLQEHDLQKVIDCMTKGDKIIYSGYIESKKENLRGIPDLLIRNDYISTIFSSLDEDFKDDSKKPYYIPVEIKFSTIHLDRSEKYILNIDRMKIYKTQLFAYCKILEEIQGVLPSKALIIGKRSLGKGCVFDPLVVPGFVDYSTKDNDVVRSFHEGLTWLRYVNINKSSMKLSPELYPNMKVQNFLFSKEKQQVSEEVGEITEIFYCGMRNRKIAHDKGVTSWKDSMCSADILEVREDQKKTVDMILKINRGEMGDFYPNKFSDKNTNGWADYSSAEMFVDFETIRNSLENDVEASEERIFLIGAQFKGEYSSFLLKSLDLVEERRVLNDFYDFWIGCGKPKVWYWYAELGMWNRAQLRHSGLGDVKWSDLYEVFYKEPFVVKGCKNFKLKSYAKALKNLGLIEIDTPNDGDCGDGLGALLLAWKYYSGGGGNMDGVLRYNRLDCEYCQKLLEFIRSSF